MQTECGEALERVSRYTLKRLVLDEKIPHAIQIFRPRDVPDDVAKRLFAPFDLRKELGLVDYNERADREAAVAVLGSVHRRLRQGLLEPLPPLVASQLGRWRLKSLCVLVDVRTKQEAKRIELEVTGREPLAVCLGGLPAADVLVGGWRQRRVEVGPISARPRGCDAVFPETTRDNGGKMWSFWCPRCDKRTRSSEVQGAKRNPERELRNELASLYPVMRRRR
ncbi:MAG: hypothetical protein ABIR67_10635 [Gaiellaceae bacterium]